MMTIREYINYYHVTLFLHFEVKGKTVYFLLSECSCELLDIKQFFYYCDISKLQETITDIQLYFDIRYRAKTDREDDDELFVHTHLIPEFPIEYINDISETSYSDRLVKYTMFREAT